MVRHCFEVLCLLSLPYICSDKRNICFDIQNVHSDKHYVLRHAKHMFRQTKHFGKQNISLDVLFVEVKALQGSLNLFAIFGVKNILPFMSISVCPYKII